MFVETSRQKRLQRRLTTNCGVEQPPQQQQQQTIPQQQIEDTNQMADAAEMPHRNGRAQSEPINSPPNRHDTAASERVNEAFVVEFEEEDEAPPTYEIAITSASARNNIVIDPFQSLHPPPDYDGNERKLQDLLHARQQAIIIGDRHIAAANRGSRAFRSRMNTGNVVQLTRRQWLLRTTLSFAFGFLFLMLMIVILWRAFITLD